MGEGGRVAFHDMFNAIFTTVVMSEHRAIGGGNLNAICTSPGMSEHRATGGGNVNAICTSPGMSEHRGGWVMLNTIWYKSWDVRAKNHRGRVMLMQFVLLLGCHST